MSYCFSDKIANSYPFFFSLRIMKYETNNDNPKKKGTVINNIASPLKLNNVEIIMADATPNPMDINNKPVDKRKHLL